MKIFDISQEVFSCAVFPGDRGPERIVPVSIQGGDICNTSELYMGSHNGTHVDAPYHFYEQGKTIDQVALERFIGKCYVSFAKGPFTVEDAEALLKKASAADPECAKRLLIGGDMVITLEAAEVFAREKIFLVGNESQTIGPMEAPAPLHYVLLAAEVVLLEGIRLTGVSEGVYLLNAAPLNLGGSDGAPCRAVLLQI